MHPDIPDGSAPDVFNALKNGYSYLWKPSRQYNRRAFDIIDVIVTNTGVEIRVDNEYLVDEVKWKTHNPEIDQTEAIHSGYKISLNDVPEYSRFVRAEIRGEDGTIYTQPFYLKRKQL